MADNKKEKGIKKLKIKKPIKKAEPKKLENKVAKETGFETKEVIMITIITFIVSIIMGCALGFNLNKNKNADLDSDVKEFLRQYNYIKENNIDGIESPELIKGAIEGMLNLIEDDYSYVIDEEEQENFNIRLNGEYEGIGIEIIGTTDSSIYIYSVFDDSPADKAGLKVGDIITKVDGESMEKKTTTEVANYIKKDKKDTFDITYKRDDKEETVTIKRDIVTINAVASEIYKENNKKIGYIYIDIFSNSAYKQFKQQLEDMEDEIDSLIIDVRYNNGGHLSTAQNILSLFLDSSNITYQTEKDDKISKFYSTGKETKAYPIVVIQNSSSASASEMLSAGLKESYGAKIVGEKSYGKGTIQELITLSDGTEYKFTTKKWLTPKGNWIHKNGVEVYYEVSLPEDYFNNPTEEKDTQLQKAIDVLSE